MTKAIENDLYPMHVFRFHVEFKEQMLTSDSEGSEVILCSGAFAECSGLEATMEPKVIKEGGRNWGAHQRAGQVTFATLILKRGMTSTKDLWKWFDLVGQGALPVKFKAADLNAKGSDVAVEELHLAHEGLTQESAAKSSLFQGT
jgi:hypothetical protein